MDLVHYYTNIEELMEYVNDSIISIKLKKTNQNIDSFAACWALSMMSHAIPLEYSETLWETLFEEGWQGFKKIIEAIVMVLKPELLE
mmetsp:Transcript_29239/g.25850  ORF Transcript_29239/g.25850 Transcript_29239/m.25850 type:complete len:87 (-) Transcript_29239:222-482(-)